MRILNEMEIDTVCGGFIKIDIPVPPNPGPMIPENPGPLFNPRFFPVPIPVPDPTGPLIPDGPPEFRF